MTKYSFYLVRAYDPIESMVIEAGYIAKDEEVAIAHFINNHLHIFVQQKRTLVNVIAGKNQRKNFKIVWKSPSKYAIVGIGELTIKE